MAEAVGHLEVGEVGVQVDHGPARLAHQVVVWRAVGVEPGRSGAEVELVELPHGRQVVQRLVDGLQGDGRHLDPSGVEDPLGSRVTVTPVQDAEDRLTLGRDPQATVPERLGQLVR